MLVHHNKWREVLQYTCTKLENKYGVTIQSAFILNPNLTLNRENVQPNTKYCLVGCKLYKGKFSYQKMNLHLFEMQYPLGKSTQAADPEVFLRVQYLPSK